MDSRPEDDQTTQQQRTYEAPAIVDHGSLAELTLASTGSYTDGAGFGGGS
ncbi:MAG TPA: lasso RiPP family leader peptide-containing protein [Solirubrobacteraceae bacterium]|nr:lasso RiPP family leader peptide-containing protein [Solirubrobacteraceae bacterium]